MKLKGLKYKKEDITSNYTKVPNSLIFDANLSIYERLIIMAVLTNNDNWILPYTGLAKKLGIDKRNLIRVWKKLINKNYLIIIDDTLSINYNMLIKDSCDGGLKPPTNNVDGGLKPPTNDNVDGGLKPPIPPKKVAQNHLDGGLKPPMKVAQNHHMNKTIKELNKTNNKTIPQEENFSADQIKWSTDLENIIGECLNEKEKKEFINYTIDNKLFTDNSILFDNHPLSIRIGIFYKQLFPTENN